MYKFMFKTLLISTIILFLISFTINFSMRNVDEIITEAPHYMNDNGFILIGYVECNRNIIYGGLVEYYGINRDGNIYRIIITKWGDELIVYEMNPINYNVPNLN